MFYKNRLEDLKILKKNYRDEEVLVIGGFLIIIITLICWFILYQIKFIERELFDKYFFLSFVIGATGFLDDLAGSRDSKGLKGHFNTLKKGVLTTGIIKVVIISVTAFFLVLSFKESILELIISTGIIIFMSNLINLLDLQPGRSIKFFILISFLLILRGEGLIYFLPYYLSFFIYLPLELNENIMLGDCGANLLGFVLGYNIVLNIKNIYCLILIFLFVFIMNLLSEKHSFTLIIKNNSVLNWIDSLGRK